MSCRHNDYCSNQNIDPKYRIDTYALAILLVRHTASSTSIGDILHLVTTNQ